MTRNDQSRMPDQRNLDPDLQDPNLRTNPGNTKNAQTNPANQGASGQWKGLDENSQAEGRASWRDIGAVDEDDETATTAPAKNQPMRADKPASGADRGSCGCGG